MKALNTLLAEDVYLLIYLYGLHTISSSNLHILVQSLEVKYQEIDIFQRLEAKLLMPDN